ncbi:MAG: dihydroorotase [Chloroflexota bacterium]|nr:MAG: dihydroorotase [Chloroflexota bacterium]
MNRGVDRGALLIRGGRILDPGQDLDVIGDVLIQDGLVVSAGPSVGPSTEGLAGVRVLEATGKVVAPGFVDLHCHLREPGYEHKETIASGTRAAARGGFTTICCMPNTRPVTDTRACVEQILELTRTVGAVRVLPIGCVTRGQRGQELADMGELCEAGAAGFSDDGNPVADAQIMRRALEYSRMLGRPIVNHCEDPALAGEGVANEGWVATRLGLRGMPAVAEEVMVARDVALAQTTGGRLHLAHISAAGSLDHIRRAKARGVPVTAEVTPHHLAMTDAWLLGYSTDLNERAYGYARPPRGLMPYDTHTKVNPPLRTSRDLDALVEALRDGTLDAIATDHAPHALEDKECEYDSAAFGIGGFETAFGLLLTLVHAGQLDLQTVIGTLTNGPARVLAGGAQGGAWLPNGLGTLRPGAPGDVAILDPEAEWLVEPETFASLGRNTPLGGVTLRGRVTATIFGGQVIYGA